ncbi:plasmid pRiA4b ORF-3 family protein [Bacillaceae bacterium S4-13-56]
MFVQCTKKLLGELKMEPEQSSSEELDPLFCWHANIILMNRKKTIVLVNDKNRYVVVLHGVKAEDFKRMDQLILNAIETTLLDEEIDIEIVKKYVRESSQVIFGKTGDRKLVARMNRDCKEIMFFEEHLNSNEIIQSELARRKSRLLVGDGAKSYMYPSEEMFKHLEIYFGKRLFTSQAAIFKITLDLKGEKVWRRVIVPLHYNFRQFHELIQIAFGWQCEHLYEFYIFSSEKTSKLKPWENAIGHVVADQELFESSHGDKMQLDKDTKLNEYFLDHKCGKYIYDFGDQWKHWIEVEEIRDDYSNRYPECVDGEGKTPPEDVGGSDGYDFFLEVMSDKTHPEHRYMLDWAMHQGYVEFQIDRVNAMIRSHFK